jgi:quercetin dioxygenase-like cupin family protein
MIYLEKDAEVKVDSDGILGRILASTPSGNFVRMTLQAGATLAPHPVPMDAHFFVISGSGRLTLNDETFVVEAGSLVPVPAGALRGWENLGSEPLELFVIK